MPNMKESFDNHSGTVYSTSQGRMCPTCTKPISDCSCSQYSEEPLGDGQVRVSRETKGRKGKGVTLVCGLPVDAKGLQKLAKQLKRKCGAGGTVKDGVIEIQGEHRDLLVQALKEVGFSVAKPQATFYCYVECPSGTESGEVFETAGAFSEFLIREALISTVPWDDAGRYVRFSATFEAADPEEEKQIIKEMKERMQKLRLVIAS